MITNKTMKISLEVPLNLYMELEKLFPQPKAHADKEFDKRLLLEILLTKTLFKALKSQRQLRFEGESRKKLCVQFPENQSVR